MHWASGCPWDLEKISPDSDARCVFLQNWITRFWIDLREQEVVVVVVVAGGGGGGVARSEIYNRCFFLKFSTPFRKVSTPFHKTLGAVYFWDSFFTL